MCASFDSLNCQGVSPGDREYETLRTRYFHARVPNTRPAKIFQPRTTLEVVDILQDARLNNSKVGVRSGGHLFPCCSLLPGGVLIDTCNLNQGINYSPHTGIVTFPPCARSKDLAEALTSVGRFFPFGHSPTVAAGGFLLAGGQGWFMRGWGCTSDKWVEQMEIVTANGAIVKASKTQNVDMFWAARGSGQGFFGVVTKIWGRTIPTRRLWETVLVFDCTESFSGILHSLFELTDRTPKYGVEVAFATFRPDRDDASLDDEEVNDKRVFMAASTLAFADTYAEAKTMLSPWESLPNILVQHQIESIPITERSWNDLFEAQDKLNPSGNGERWQCDSILNRPEVKREQLIEAIKPALWDLPTRRSIGCIYVGNYSPDETEQAISIPQQYYIASMTCWTSPSWDDRMSRWMREVYTRASEVSCGQYIADFDANQRIAPVLTENALRRFLAIRLKWDPRETFIGHRGFSGSTTISPSL